MPARERVIGRGSGSGGEASEDEDEPASDVTAVGEAVVDEAAADEAAAPPRPSSSSLPFDLNLQDCLNADDMDWCCKHHAALPLF